METIDPKLREVLDHSHEGAYVVDRERRIVYWNPASEIITGFRAADVLGHCCSANILTHIDAAGTNLCLHACPVSQTLDDGAFREAKVYLHHRDGHRVPVSVRVVPLRDVAGATVGAIELFADLGNHATLEARVALLESLAMLDPLTQLANRRYLSLELKKRLDEFNRYATPLGVLFLDIDGFKRINDTHGHNVGDMLLRSVASTLRANCRPFDTFGRWGGDEFVGLLRHLDAQALGAIAERLRLLIEHVYLEIDGASVGVTVSIGMALAHEGDTDLTLMERADRRMLAGKRAGRNRVCGE
jgi:diguanylate cyclase (GGDEF)-like protein/PAS domain S-box-containing protein